MDLNKFYKVYNQQKYIFLLKLFFVNKHRSANSFHQSTHCYISSGKFYPSLCDDRKKKLTKWRN